MSYIYSPETLPFSDVYRAYMDCRKNKRGTHNALSFEVNLESNLVQLWKDILSGTYKIGRSIAFIVTHPRMREIFAADFRDRIVHHLVIRRLEPLFEARFIEDNCNCRKDKGALYGIKRLAERINISPDDPKYNDMYIARFDMENFFMHIHRPTLWKMLEEFISERFHEVDRQLMLDLVKMIVLHCPEKNCIRRSDRSMWDALDSRKSLFTTGDDWGLPIGNLSSQVFANFLLNEFDIRFLDDGMCARYVDDFYIIGTKNDILRKICMIRWELSRVGVTLHRRKFYMQHISKGTSFLGTQCLPGRTYVRNSTVHNALRMIDSYNHIKVKEPHAEKFVQLLNSYLGYMSHFLSYGIRYRIMEAISLLWGEYIYFGNSIMKVSLKKKYRAHICVRGHVADSRKGRFKG